MRPTYGSTPNGRPKSVGADLYQSIRLSGEVGSAKVFAFGPVAHRRPRSSMVTGTPAWVSRSAVTPPPKPDPITTTRCSSRRTGMRPGRGAVGSAVAVPNPAPAAATAAPAAPAPARKVLRPNPFTVDPRRVVSCVTRKTRQEPVKVSKT